MKKVFVLLFLGAMLSVPAAQAASPATGTLLVLATVYKSCRLSTYTVGTGTYSAVLDFGDVTEALADGFEPTGTTGDSTATGLTVRCNPNTTYTVTLGGGDYSSGGQRYMMLTGGGDSLPYNLYSDAGYSSAIAIDGALVSDKTVTDATAQVFPIYGKIPNSSALFPTPGTYQDTVAITVTYF